MKVTRLTQFPAHDAVHSSLTPGRIYEVLGIEGNWFRILDDYDQPVLFDPTWFQIVDHAVPSNWVQTIKDSQRYAYPPEWNFPGFFEDWHDNVSGVREAFWNRLTEWHPETAREQR